MMTTPLADLRRLLEGALTRGGPAIDRLPERTVEALATAYLPRSLSALDGERALHYHAVHMLLWWSGIERLDLTDPGTTRAILVALALYLGRDPGEGALGVAWCPVDDGFQLSASRVCVRFMSAEHPHGWYGRTVFAPTVAAEPDPIRALALAVAHVLA
jgi:hypothetical protein